MAPIVSIASMAPIVSIASMAPIVSMPPIAPMAPIASPRLHKNLCLDAVAFNKCL